MSDKKIGCPVKNFEGTLCSGHAAFIDYCRQCSCYKPGAAEAVDVSKIPINKPGYFRHKFTVLKNGTVLIDNFKGRKI